MKSIDMKQIIQKMDIIQSISEDLLKMQPEIGYSQYEMSINKALQINSPLDVYKTTEGSTQTRALQLESLTNVQITANSDYHIAIIGAGSAGLLAAYYLSQQGFKISVYEKRSEKLATLRYPNISFKEAELRLKPLLGQSIYQQCFQYGGSLDGNTGKLRLTIGCFQEILLKELKSKENVNLHFGQEINLHNPSQLKNYHLIIVAAGANSPDRMELNESIETKKFPEFNARGITALYVSESSGMHGYSRIDIEGEKWRRDNTSIYSGEAFTPDLQRLMRQIDDSSTINKLSALCKAKSVDYTFSFGNHGNFFFDNPPCLVEPVKIAEFEVKPQIALKPIFYKQGKKFITIGDANGTPHPLAAIGTLKFIRNIPLLSNYLCKMVMINNSNKSNKDQLHEINEFQYLNQVMKDIEEVFLANISSSLYSRPRNF